MPAACRPSRRASRALPAALAALALLTGCTKSGPANSADTTAPVAASTTTAGGPCAATGSTQAVADLPDVADIRTAISDLEGRLGGPQAFFEVNATARLVNLFVALNDGAVVQSWVWVAGDLTSQEGQPASGGTFTAADLDFDEATVLDAVREQIPTATLESFVVNGDGQGNVQYSVLTSSACGSGLDVVVGPDGAVKSVDPLD